MSKIKIPIPKRNSKTRVTSKRFKAKNRAVTKGIIEIIDLNNNEVELIARGYVRRSSKRNEISSKIQELFGSDYKTKIMNKD